MYHIVTIDECSIEGREIRDAEPAYISVSDFADAQDQIKKFLGKESVLTTFWGTWEDKKVLFMCLDMFTRDLKPNKQATLAYLGESLPGTMHVIYGPVVGLLDSELW